VLLFPLVLFFTAAMFMQPPSLYAKAAPKKAAAKAAAKAPVEQHRGVKRAAAPAHVSAAGAAAMMPLARGGAVFLDDGDVLPPTQRARRNVLPSLADIPDAPPPNAFGPPPVPVPPPLPKLGVIRHDYSPDAAKLYAVRSRPGMPHMPWMVNYAPGEVPAHVPAHMRSPSGGALVVYAPWVKMKGELPPHKVRVKGPARMPAIKDQADYNRFRAEIKASKDLQDDPRTGKTGLFLAGEMLDKMADQTPPGWQIKSVFRGGVNSVAYLIVNPAGKQLVQKLPLTTSEKRAAVSEYNFAKRAEALGLQHIMRPVDTGQLNGVDRFTYAVAAGVNINECMNKPRSWWVVNGPFIIKGLKRAFKEMHNTLKMAHNDLHGGNFLYDEVTHSITLIDFGMARDAQSFDVYDPDTRSRGGDYLPLWSKQWAYPMFKQCPNDFLITWHQYDQTALKYFDVARLHAYTQIFKDKIAGSTTVVSADPAFYMFDAFSFIGTPGQPATWVSLAGGTTAHWNRMPAAWRQYDNHMDTHRFWVGSFETAGFVYACEWYYPLAEMSHQRLARETAAAAADPSYRPTYTAAQRDRQNLWDTIGGRMPAYNQLVTNSPIVRTPIRDVGDPDPDLAFAPPPPTAVVAKPVARRLKPAPRGAGALMAALGGGPNVVNPFGP